VRLQCNATYKVFGLSILMSVCLSVKRLHFDKTKETVGLYPRLLLRAVLTYLGRVCTVLVGLHNFFTIKTDDPFCRRCFDP